MKEQMSRYKTLRRFNFCDMEPVEVGTITQEADQAEIDKAWSKFKGDDGGSPNKSGIDMVATGQWVIIKLGGKFRIVGHNEVEKIS